MFTSEIDTPSAGDKMRASWGAAVARAVNAHEAELQSLRQPGKWKSDRIEDETQPHPFEVRQVWVSEEGSTTKVAKWCIYLPLDILYLANTAVDAKDGLTAADGAPADWYELPEFPGEEASGSVYLHVTLPGDESEEESGEETESEGEDESHEAEIVTEFGEQGERDVYIEIATVASDGKVSQKVVGTLVVGKDGNIGVTSLNELTGDVEIVAGDESVTVAGKELSLSVDVERGDNKITISLSDDGSGEGGEDETVAGYCNDISDDGVGENDLSGFGVGGGGGAYAEDVDNDISLWPCNY